MSETPVERDELDALLRTLEQRMIDTSRLLQRRTKEWNELQQRLKSTESLMGQLLIDREEQERKGMTGEEQEDSLRRTSIDALNRQISVHEETIAQLQDKTQQLTNERLTLDNQIKLLTDERLATQQRVKRVERQLRQANNQLKNVSNFGVYQNLLQWYLEDKDFLLSSIDSQVAREFFKQQLRVDKHNPSSIQDVISLTNNAIAHGILHVRKTGKDPAEFFRVSGKANLELLNRLMTQYVPIVY